jgi:hypothetical protein
MGKGVGFEPTMFTAGVAGGRQRACCRRRTERAPGGRDGREQRARDRRGGTVVRKAGERASW